MKAGYLISTLIAVSLLVPASTGVARIEAAQDASIQHMDHGSSTLPAAVRRATERFLDVNDAIATGYVQFQGCVSGQDLGAMGVHYVNPSLFDDRLEVEHPEALVYEPKRGRRLQLVAVEYITPAAAWQGSHDAGVQPDLNGHLFHFAAGPNRYGPAAFFELHVWAWKDNPRGTFADWNPAVSCVEFDDAAF